MSTNSMAKYHGIGDGPGGSGTTNNPQPTWTRYTDYFLNAYNTTGIAMSVDIVNLGPYTCTLISNRHVLLARHVGIAAGSNVYFVNNSNVTFTYQIISMQTVGPAAATDPGYTDISIGYLDRPIDTTLQFLKVVPANFLNYLQTSFIKTLDGNDNEVDDLSVPFISPVLPVLYNTNGWYPNPAAGSTDTWRRTWCGTLKLAFGVHQSTLDYSSPPASFLSHAFPITGAKYNNSEALRTGDSGNIVFIPINSEIVILGAWYQGGSERVAGQGIGTTSFLAPYITQINSAMTTLAGGTSYSLTQANLSGFKTF